MDPCKECIGAYGIPLCLQDEYCPVENADYRRSKSDAEKTMCQYCLSLHQVECCADIRGLKCNDGTLVVKLLTEKSKIMAELETIKNNLDKLVSGPAEQTIQIRDHVWSVIELYRDEPGSINRREVEK